MFTYLESRIKCSSGGINVKSIFATLVNPGTFGFKTIVRRERKEEEKRGECFVVN